MPEARSATELRARLADARLMLVFTPGLCRPGADPLEVLRDVVPHVDAVQVRIKDGEHPRAPGPARELHEWTRRVLACVARSGRDVLVLVNDRVDVAAVLEPEGVAGVHLGAADCPPGAAREILGPRLLVGLSTHSARDVALAEAEPVDYLGYGPVFPTATKGVTRGLGAEAAWVAASAASRPLFPIGGIDPANAQELERVGRAAVSSAILQAGDPAAAASAIRSFLAAP